MTARLAVGQRWAVGGITYRIESLRGPDGCYPIELVEVARDVDLDVAIRAQIAALPPALLGCSLLPKTLERRRMSQEARWFERSDVQQVRR